MQRLWRRRLSAARERRLKIRGLATLHRFGPRLAAVLEHGALIVRVQDIEITRGKAL